MTAHPQGAATTMTDNNNSNKTCSSLSPTRITADEVISQSCSLNERGLQQLMNGEESSLPSAIVCFQESLKCMSQCFSRDTSPEHWENSFSANKRCRDGNNNDTCTSSFPIQTSLSVIKCHSWQRSQTAELVFRRAFCTSQVHTIFQRETCHFKRTMNLTAAFVHFNLALTHQLSAMTTAMKMKTRQLTGAVAANDARSNEKQKRLSIHTSLKSAQRCYQEAYRFMVSSYPQIHNGRPAPYLMLNIFYMACVSNMAQVEASLGSSSTERVRAFLCQLMRFVSIMKTSRSLTVRSQPTMSGMAPAQQQQQQHCPDEQRRRVRRRTSSSSYITVAHGANRATPTAVNVVDATNAFVARRATDFFSCVLVAHDYLLSSAAAAA